jgi:hypothetical protein
MNDVSRPKATMDDSKGCFGLFHILLRLGISLGAEFRFEGGQDTLLSNVRKMQTALEEAGIEFEGETGLRMKKP